MTALLRPVTKMKCSIPASRASSTTCWMIGRSTTVSISLGIALVAGRKRVPRPATGNIALRMGDMAEMFLKTEFWEGGRCFVGKIPRDFKKRNGTSVDPLRKAPMPQPEGFGCGDCAAALLWPEIRSQWAIAAGQLIGRKPARVTNRPKAHCAGKGAG